MAGRKFYAVFGLGRYGRAVARELVENGCDVIAVDMNEALVYSASAELPVCKCADITDAEVIKQLGIADAEAVIVAMAGHLEASVMAVMLCKEIGVKTVIAKCSDDMQRKILHKVGADKVVFPEQESGTRLAKNIISSGFIDVIELSSDVSLIELDIRPEWIGKTLIELSLRKKYSINVVAIRTADALRVDIDPSMKLSSDMSLVVIANAEKIRKIK